jgi:polysaccharide biosynthesis protein PslH
MRILFVTPYPPSRIRVRSYGFLKHLQREHEITIATQWVSARELADVEALRAQGFKIIAVQEKKWQETLRSGIALFSSLPLQAAYARSRRFKQMVQRLYTQGTFDVVHVEHLRGIASLEGSAQTYPLVWDAVDCISLLCEQTMEAGASMPVRTVAFIEHQRTRRYEARLLRQLRHAMVTSERDRQVMLGILGDETDGNGEQEVGIDVLPNGVDLEYFHFWHHERHPYNIVYLGKMSYHANIASALYLCRQIMPLIWMHRPEATLTIVGSNPPDSVRDLEIDGRVKVTGYVDDVRPFVQHAGVMLCPMMYGVGIQNKVLEAMAMGTPTVVTSQIAASLKAQPECDLLVAQTAREFADSALRVLHDSALRAALGHRGREFVERHHDWSTVTNQLVDIYRQATIRKVGKKDTSAPATSLMFSGS